MFKRLIVTVFALVLAIYSNAGAGPALTLDCADMNIEHMGPWSECDEDLDEFCEDRLSGFGMSNPWYTNNCQACNKECEGTGPYEYSCCYLDVEASCPQATCWPQ